MTENNNHFEDTFAGGGVMQDGYYPQQEQQFAPDHQMQANYGAAYESHAGGSTWTPPNDAGIPTLPAISVKAFCERQATAQLIASAANDRRMGRANVEIKSGGVVAATEYLRENATPNLLILECSGSAPDVIAKIDDLAEFADENVQVVVIGMTNDVQLYRALMQRGVAEYLVPPLESLQLVVSIGNLFSDPSKFTGRSVSVIGAKGGVGSSTIAHNLAWLISCLDGTHCALMDFDLRFGTTGLDFNIETEKTIVDALSYGEQIDENLTQQLMSAVTDSLSVFVAPSHLDRIESFPESTYQLLVDNARKLMPYLILDIPHIWDGWTRDVLMSSDEIIIVCEPELASLRNVRNIYEKFLEHRPGDARPKVILNKVGLPGRPEISEREFASHMGSDVALSINFHSELFGKSLNNGKMLMEIDPNCEPNQALLNLACKMTGQKQPPAPEKKSIFKQFKAQLPL